MPDSNLSISAQTIVHEYSKIAYGNDIELSFTPLPWEKKAIAAVLRAAVVQVTPVSTNARQMKIRGELLAIADELEGVNYGTYRSELTDRPQ